MNDKRSIHLAFLDGLRGLAALYVVVFHLIATQESAGALPSVVSEGLRWLRYGHYAVDVFIVLSGYCLMLPVARATDGRIPGGIARYLYRRGRRILPPLWAALAFTLVLILLVRMTGHRVRADDGTVFEAGNLITHALLIHNWFPEYSGSINLPMWTVAVEWQIYFAFPFLLLPVWRWRGRLGTIAVGLFVGYLPRLVLPATYNFDWTRPWYLGLFAMGMAAATVHFDHKSGGIKPPVPWSYLSLAIWLTVVLIEWTGGAARSMSSLWLKDPLVGLGMATTIAFLASVVIDPSSTSSIGRRIVQLLQARPVVTLGAISYSLYLIHLPLMWIVKFGAQLVAMPPMVELLYRLTLAPAAIVFAAFVFYWFFERPFLSANAPPLAAPDRATLTLAVAASN